MHKKTNLTVRLPVGSAPAVTKGETVIKGTPLTKSAPREITEFNLQKIFGHSDISKLIIVAAGTFVEKGIVLARKKGLFKKLSVKAPISGIFEIIDEKAGVVGIEKKKAKEAITSWFAGTVVEVINNDKIIFEVSGIPFAATAGKGHPVSGMLLVVTEIVDALSMPTDIEKRILAVPEAHQDMIAKADALGARAVITQEIGATPQLPFLLLSDISVLEKFNHKQVMVYGDEKQLIIIEGS